MEKSLTLDDINKLSPAMQTELMDILERYKRGERLDAITAFYRLFGLPKTPGSVSGVTIQIQQLIKLFES